jgi:hypothetical protein
MLKNILDALLDQTTNTAHNAQIIFQQEVMVTCILCFLTVTLYWNYI